MLDPRYICGTVKHTSSLTVWGCSSRTALRKLVALPANVKVNPDVCYKLPNEHLPECFEPTGARVLHGDGAPRHTAKSVAQRLDDSQVPFTRDCPGNSPDLNTTENVWQTVKSLQGKDVSWLVKLRLKSGFLGQKYSRKSCVMLSFHCHAA